MSSVLRQGTLLGHYYRNRQSSGTHAGIHGTIQTIQTFGMNYSLRIIRLNNAEFHLFKCFVKRPIKKTLILLKNILNKHKLGYISILVESIVLQLSDLFITLIQKK